MKNIHTSSNAIFTELNTKYLQTHYFPELNFHFKTKNGIFRDKFQNIDHIYPTSFSDK